jgi:hypothetical protein
MGRDLTLDVITRASPRELRNYASALDNVGDEALGASGKLAAMGAMTEALDKRIAASKLQMQGLAEEFEKSGNVDAFRGLGSQAKSLEKLVSLRKDLGSDSGDMDTSFMSRAFQSLRKEMSSGLESLGDMAASNPAITIGIAAGITVGAPLIVTAIGSAVSLGLGSGVIALGISRALDDDSVSKAWGKFSVLASKSLDDSSAAFIGPLVRAASTLSETWAKDVGPTLSHSMTQLAPLVDNLAAGFAGMIHNIGPGFDKAMASAGPFIEILSEEMPYLGEAISSFLGHLANAGPGTEQFFGDLLVLTEDSIRALGWLIEYGSKVYMTFTAIGEAIKGNFGDAKKIMQDVWSGSGTDDANDRLGKFRDTAESTGHVTENLAQRLQNMSAGLDTVAVTADTVAGKMADKLFSSMMSLDQAALSFAEAQTHLTSAIDENGRQLDIHTAKGQANREAILSVVQANIRQFDANIAAGMSAQDAAKAYDVNTAALERQMVKAGFTQAQIDGLIGKYRSVPANVNTEIALKGLADAINGLDETLRRINGLPSRKLITIEQNYRITGTPVVIGSGNERSSPGRIIAQRYGGIRHAAQGLMPGIYPDGAEITHFAEKGTGGELFLPMRGISQNRARVLLNAGAKAHGLTSSDSGGATLVSGSRVTLEMASNGGSVERMLAEVIYGMVNTGQLRLRVGGSAVTT